MEVSILSDVMRLATILWQKPQRVSYLTESWEKVLESPDVLENLTVLKDKAIRESWLMILTKYPVLFIRPKSTT